MRAERDRVWGEGWRPPHLHVQMTTFQEKPAITRHVIESLLAEIRQMGIPSTIYVGTGTPFDEYVIGEIARDAGEDLGAELVMIRQNQPGKRMAIGLVMRAIIRKNPNPDDVIVFMDGDTVFGCHSLSRSIAMFGADPAPRRAHDRRGRDLLWSGLDAALARDALRAAAGSPCRAMRCRTRCSR
jgi:mannuronan synthase